ncbi:hypothetical protein [Chryseolinea lacunae]|uniref:Uncharacterized protein n=1 Tax=Chryseolinea lacunae TaxID=2801331 RepID=A0ABS1L0P1_9BACT|nr:hypothetical protein [Chryseolinea lacunae]MBL0745088.1 hypothetical protein [Chryseolinea lacunae]
MGEWQMIFLELIKKNAILYSILINGNFAQVDLRSQNVVAWSDRAIEIKNIRLGEHEFDSVMVVLYGSFISMEFRTADAKFFNDTKHYFGKDALVRSKKSYLMGNDVIEEEYKDLGTFKGLEGLASAMVRNSNLFGFTISLRFYGETAQAKSLSKPTYFLTGIEVAQEALHLFKPNEITLVPTFSPFDYAPRIEIVVRNSEHPVLKYVANKASLSYGNRLYEHGRIPRLDPFRVCGLTYVDQAGTDDDTLEVKSVLIVNLCASGQTSTDGNVGHISYEVLSPEVEFFQVGNRVLTKNELEASGLNLEGDYILEKTLFGKEAVDEFNNLDYAQGISVYKSKK